MPLYPKKNLLPPATDSAWALHYNAKALSSYHFYINQNGTYQTTGMDVNLKPGQQYTLSAEEMSPFAQLYIKRIIDGSYAYHIASVSSGMSVTFTAVANATYRVEFHNGTSLTEGYVKKFQLEEGPIRTTFEDYDLGLKKTGRVQKINNDMSAAGSHAYPYGNVISVKEDVRLWTAKLKVYTTGTFNIIVQEFVEGVGRVGLPIFDRKMDITSLTDFTYSFGGVELKAGKTYWVGRLSTNPELPDNVGNAAVGRSTNMEARGWKYVDAIGGTSYRSATVDFTQTWYYFYGLEIEAIGMKKATIYPNNLINLAKLTRGFYVNDVNGQLVTSGAGTCATEYIPIAPGKTYEFSGFPKTGPLQMRCAYYDRDKNHVGGFFNFDPSFEKVIPDNAYFVRLSISPGDFATANMNLKGDRVFKKTKGYPVENILPPLDSSEWIVGGNANLLDATDRTATFNFPNTSAGSYFCYVPVIPGKNYTISLKQNDAFSKCRLRVGKGTDTSLINSTGIYETSKTITAPAGVYSFYVTLDNNNEKGGNTAGTFTFEDVSITQSDSLLPYKPYANVMKPAKLYPKKNYVLPYTLKPWSFSSNNPQVSQPITDFPFMRVDGEYSFSFIDKPAGWYSCNILVPVEPDTTYTYSNKYEATNTNQSVRLNALKSDLSLGANNILFNGSMVVQPNTLRGSVTVKTNNDTAFIQIMLQTGSAGTFRFSDWQLEKGAVATAFEQYQLGMKQ